MGDAKTDKKMQPSLLGPKDRAKKDLERNPGNPKNKRLTPVDVSLEQRLIQEHEQERRAGYGPFGDDPDADHTSPA